MQIRAFIGNDIRIDKGFFFGGKRILIAKEHQNNLGQRFGKALGQGHDIGFKQSCQLDILFHCQFIPRKVFLSPAERL